MYEESFKARQNRKMADDRREIGSFKMKKRGHTHTKLTALFMLLGWSSRRTADRVLLR
jgi:hypothetical protein